MGELTSMAYKNVSSASGAGVVVATKPSLFYGIGLFPATTGVVQVAVFDSTATAVGNQIFAYRVASTAGADTIVLNHPIACRIGIYVSTILMTTAADNGVVFYS